MEEQTQEQRKKELFVLPLLPREEAEEAPARREGKTRVALYARVSTEKDEQLSSYEAQVRYYSEYIAARPEWTLAGIYTDEGITGTSAKKRKGFCRMIADALAGKIDLVVTKSISRFARNTVDSLTAIRRLRAAGVGVWFEKENISTLDGKGELLITIMSSLAQEESRSISQNVSWGIRRMHAQGRSTVPFSQLLGYRRGEDCWLAIDPDGAKTVETIFSLFLEGETPYRIAKRLEKEGVPSPVGAKKWYGQTVGSILRNEKYKGDLLIQKTYIKDFLTKEKVKNRGEVQQYYVKNDHPAIIPPEIFDRVQEELARRAAERVDRQGSR